MLSRVLDVRAVVLSKHVTRCGLAFALLFFAKALAALSV